MGFARYGFKTEAAQLFTALFDAATYQDLRRLPELFCGFKRRPHRGPTSYPVACVPQAWAAAAPFGFLAASLGLTLDHQKNQINFTDPVLPAFLDAVSLKGLLLGASRLDILLNRHGTDVTVNVLARTGHAKVLLQK
jgi:glycogen debranching enzyme